MKREKRYVLRLADAATVKQMGEQVYFVKEWADGRNVEWTRGKAYGTTFSRAGIDAFKVKYPHIGGRVIRTMS